MALEIIYHLSRQKIEHPDKADAMIENKFQGFAPVIGDEVFFPAGEVGYDEFESFVSVGFTVYRRWVIHEKKGSIDAIVIYASMA